MKKDGKFFNMILLFVIAGISLIAFVVLLVNYEIEKPNLPTPTPIVVPTSTPIPTNTPTPTPGFTKGEWNKLYTEEFSSYEIEEIITGSDGVALKNIYKMANGSSYYFNQTSEKTATETWYLITEENFVQVTGKVNLNIEGGFDVDNNGYKSTISNEKTVADKYDTFVKDAKARIEKYHTEIPFKQYLSVEAFKVYKTDSDNKYKSTVKINDGKIESIEVEYVDDTDPEKPITIKVRIKMNSITGEDILQSSPVK